MQKKQQNELLGEHVYTNLPPTRHTNRRAAGQRNKPIIRVRVTTQHTKRQYTKGREAGGYTRQQHKQVGLYNITITIGFNAHNLQYQKELIKWFRG
jgi:hypothetical protein